MPAPITAAISVIVPEVIQAAEPLICKGSGDKVSIEQHLGSTPSMLCSDICYKKVLFDSSNLPGNIQNELPAQRIEHNPLSMMQLQKPAWLKPGWDCSLMLTFGVGPASAAGPVAAAVAEAVFGAGAVHWGEGWPWWEAESSLRHCLEVQCSAFGGIARFQQS